jgi:Bacterial extracellular solute-binding protein, family 7
VLESRLGEQMLEGVKGVGVVGVAVHPGPLRRPFGLSRGLARPEDYRGARIGIRPGAVAQATLRALGGAAEGYVPGSLSGLDGVEIDPKTVAYNGWDRQGGFLTENVVLWPKPYSIVMNREAFEALDSEQQEILFAAGRAALVPELRQTERDAAAAMAEICRHGQLSLVTASAAELAALREAVQPVYDELERDSLTRELISGIDDMRESLAEGAALPRCIKTGSRTVRGAAPFEGRWKLTWTRDELIAVGISENNLKGAPDAGSLIAEFKAGRYRGIVDGRVLTKGTYTVEGDVLNLVYQAPVLRGYVVGQVYRHRWSVFRNSLTFSRVVGSDADLVLLVKPLTRVR